MIIKVLASGIAAASVIPFFYALWGLYDGSTLSEALFVYLVGSAICVLHLVILAWPSLYFLNRSGRLNKISTTWLGFAIGAVPIFLFLAIVESLKAASLTALLFGIFGAISARVFWLTWSSMS